MRVTRWRGLSGRRHWTRKAIGVDASERPSADKPHCPLSRVSRIATTTVTPDVYSSGVATVDSAIVPATPHLSHECDDDAAQKNANNFFVSAEQKKNCVA